MPAVSRARPTPSFHQPPLAACDNGNRPGTLRTPAVTPAPSAGPAPPGQPRRPHSSRTCDLATGRSLSRIAIRGESGVSAIALLAPDQVLYADGGTLSLYAATRDAAPVLTIELDSEVHALAAYRTSVMAATSLGLVALDIPQ
jgi:hypothetical protein